MQSQQRVPNNPDCSDTTRDVSCQTSPCSCTYTPWVNDTGGCDGDCFDEGTQTQVRARVRHDCHGDVVVS
jgi:hypothetical protein